MKFIIWLPDHTKELQNEFRTSLVNLFRERDSHHFPHVIHSRSIFSVVQ